MKISGFTFLRNGQKLGYPFAESIRSILPIVDEFVIALGPCDDQTEKMLREIGDAKIHIIPTQWNENIRPDQFGSGQLFVLICLPHRGLDLELYFLSNWNQAASILWQVSNALANAEEDHFFEESLRLL